MAPAVQPERLGQRWSAFLRSLRRAFNRDCDAARWRRERMTVCSTPRSIRHRAGTVWVSTTSDPASN